MTLTRIAGPTVLLVLFAGCATGAPPTPDAVFRHPVTGDVQWCDQGSVAATILVGSMMGAAQGADYAGCKTKWEDKGYARLDPTQRLSPADQQRYDAELDRIAKEKAESIRVK